MSEFDRDEYMRMGQTQYPPTPQLGEGVFGSDTTWLDSLQSFGGSFADYNLVAQGIDKIKGQHYTDTIAYAREQAREQEEALVGPKPLYDPFTDPKIQSLPNEFLKYGAGVESEREAFAFSETVKHYEAVKKNRMKSGGSAVLGMVMGELISPANIYGLRIAQSTKELTKIIGAFSAEELAQHALQPERTSTDSALNIGIIGGFNAAMLGHKKFKESAFTRAVPDYSGDVERVVLQHFDDTIDNFKQTNTASEAEIVPDLNDAIQVQKKRDLDSLSESEDDIGGFKEVPLSQAPTEAQVAENIKSGDYSSTAAPVKAETGVPFKQTLYRGVGERYGNNNFVPTKWEDILDLSGGDGTFFGLNLGQAQFFARSKTGGKDGKIFSKEVSLENPLVLRTEADFNKMLKDVDVHGIDVDGKRVEVSYEDGNFQQLRWGVSGSIDTAIKEGATLVNAEKIVDHIKSLGHDGIVVDASHLVAKEGRNSKLFKITDQSQVVVFGKKTKNEDGSFSDELPMEEGNLPEFQFIEEADPKLKNVDQRANPDNTIAPAWWLDKIPDGPVKRALSSGSSYGKSIMTDLVEHPFVQLKNLGENPAATQAGVDRLNAINWQAPMVDTMQATEQLYLRYRQRVSDSSATTMTGQVVRDLRGTGDAIGFDEFLGEVGKTKGNRGARTDIQEIVEASALWHEKVYKPMGEAAKKSGMFSQNLQRARSVKLAELKEARRAGTPEAIKAIQSELDDIAKQIDEADNIDLSPNFLNRIYKKDEIKSRRAEFTNILINRGGRSEEEASGIIDAILGQTARHAELDIDGPAIEMGKVGRAASLKERSLDDIDDIDFGDFLEHNIFAVGKYYTSRVGPDIELTRKFGSIDMHDQLKAISDAHDLRIKNAAPHEVDKFKAMKDQELDDIRVVRDRIRGTYGLPDDPDSYTNRGMRIAKMMNATTMLTGAISAVPDMGRLVMYDGMTRSFGTVFDALTKNMDTLKMAKGEAQLAGEALDMYLSMRAALFTDLSDAMSTTSQFERIAAKATQQFFNVSLMNPWNVGVKTMASLITGSRILEESIKWASPLRNSAGVPVKYGEVISNFNGNRIAASYNPKTKEITMDLEKLRESYDRKGWTQPRNGVTPLPEKQFKNFEEFRDFVIEHELAHTDFRPNKGETIPQYEDRINQIALKRVGHRGKPSVEFEQSKLAQSGIDANMAGRISAQFEQYGMREGRVMIAQTKKWKDRGAAQAYTAALGKDINTIIVTPGAGDLPSSMSGGLEKLDIAKGRKAERVAKVESGEELNRWEKIEDTFMGPQVAQMLFQFKSFGASATQRILVPGLQRPDKNFLIGAAGLVALGVMVDHIRDGQLGSKRPKTSSQRLKAGIDRSGMLGWFGDANGALETLSDGRFGIGPMMGDHGYKRSKLNKLGAVAGPSVSQGKNIARLLYGLSDGSMGKRDAYYARSIMPTNRVFWADGFFDFTQSAIGPK